MGVPSRTSAPTPVLIENSGLQIILGKVRPFASPRREPSTGSDHFSVVPGLAIIDPAVRQPASTIFRLIGLAFLVLGVNGLMTSRQSRSFRRWARLREAEEGSRIMKE
jgi:hypothetical protein